MAGSLANFSQELELELGEKQEMTGYEDY
jgi:hypothetical protein